MRREIAALVISTLAVTGTGAAAQDSVLVGHLADYTGATSFVGKQFGPGVSDAFKQINADGGIDGTSVNLDTVDYAYKVPEAVALYKRWVSNGMVALQGWGTADTEALITFVTRDEIPNMSGSYSAHLTDPKGANPNTKLPAPYNFFYGPSYSDACRALVEWAKKDADSKGIENATFIHTGDNHPYPNAPKEACAAHAQEIGLTVAPPVVVPLAPGDFKAQCLTIKNTGAQYVYMGNLGGSVVSLIKSCNTVGVEATYMGNPWAGDYQTVGAAEAQNLIFPSSTPFYGADVPGMALVTKILENGDGQVGERPTHHYVRAVCAAYYMKEAMDWAKANGGLTGKNIRDGFYQKADWVPEGLEGVCGPVTWTPEDHRGLTRVTINSGSFVDGEAEIETIDLIELPRREDWLGQ